jgi:cell division transport system permease protein
MLVTLLRIIKYGWQGFLRNGWLSASTVSIMVLTLIVFEGLIIFNFIGKGAITSIKEKVDISVYFKSNVPEDSVLNMKRSLEGLEEVKEVEYITREEALEEFKKRHAGEETITQTLEELNTNPLLASLNIKAKELNQYENIANYLKSASLEDKIEKVTYAQNQVVIERLTAFVTTLKKSVITLTAFLAFLAVVVIFNTIRLAIFSTSEQIGIMRIVGASNTFIRGPFVVEGIIYGVIAATLSFLLLIPVIHLTSPYISNFIPEINLITHLDNQWLNLLGYQFVFGVGLGIVSSTFAIRRYLKV